MQIAGRNQPLSEMSLVDGFCALRDAGADAVELCHEHPAMAPQLMDEAVARKIAESLTEARLNASAVGWHCDYIADDENYRRIQQIIPLAPLFGTDVFITACVARGGTADPQRRLVERTRRLCELARSAGVRLAVEYEPNFIIDDAESLLRLMDAVGSDALAANLDLGHAFLQESDPLDAIRRLGNRIVHCHVEGMATGVHRHLLPWEGEMDLQACVCALREVGFDGALALDLYGVDYAAVAPRCFEYLRRFTG